MTEPSSIFRREALESREAGDRASGQPLRLDSPWLRWSYWAVLALVVAGVITTMLVRTEATATGPAVVNPDGTFAALIPAAAAPDLEDARTVRIESIDGAEGVRATAAVDQAEPADDATVARLGLPPLEGPAILLSGALARTEPSALPPRETEATGRAVLVIRSEPILGMFARRVSGMLG
jgi:hypothetical protein